MPGLVCMQLTGELPHGFTVALQQFFEEQQKAKSKSAAKPKAVMILKT